MKKILLVFLVLLVTVTLAGCATTATQGLKVTSIAEVENQLKTEWQTEKDQLANIKMSSPTRKGVEGGVDVALGLGYGLAALANPASIDAPWAIYTALKTADGTAAMASAIQEKDTAILFLNFKHNIVLAKERGSEKYEIANVAKTIIESKQVVPKYPFAVNISNIPDRTRLYVDNSGSKIQITDQLKLMVKCKTAETGCNRSEAEEFARSFADILAKEIVNNTLK